MILIHRDRKTLDQFPEDFKVIIKKNMEDQEFFLVNLIKSKFFCLFFINSTAGWSKGFNFIILPSKIVSNIKKVNNSPSVSSFLFDTSKLLKGIFFALKTFLVACF